MGNLGIILYTLTKLILTILVVVVLTEISKRVSPNLAGILAGLPLGTGLSVYFICYEQGIDFTIRSVPWGIAGLSASLIFILTYFLVERLSRFNSRILSIVSTTISSLVLFLFYGLLLSTIKFSLLQATILFLVVFVINLFVVKKLIKRQEVPSKSRSTLMQLLVRGIAVGVILLLITEVASAVGSKWAGILSSFPSTLFPLILILHYEDGNRNFPNAIFGFSYSVSTLIVFYFSFLYFVPIHGLYYGFFMTYSICVIYLYLLQKIQKKFTLI